MRVARAPAAWPSRAVMSWSGRWRSVSTLWRTAEFLRQVALDLVAQRRLPRPSDRGIKREGGDQHHECKGRQELEEDPILTWGPRSGSRPAHRLEVARVLRIGLDFFPDAADVDIDRTGRYVGSVTPDGIEELVAGEDAAEVTGEVVEQTELGGGRRDQFAAHGQGHGGRVDFNLAHAHGSRGQRPLKAAQHSFHAGDQFPGLKGFGM